MSNPIFRVHFEDGTKLDIPAADVKAATKAAEKHNDGIIRKIKIVRESSQCQAS